MNMFNCYMIDKNSKVVLTLATNATISEMEKVQEQAESVVDHNIKFQAYQVMKDPNLEKESSSIWK